MLNRWTMVTAAAMVFASGAVAQQQAAPTLKVGDKAPALTVENWVKGKEIKKFEEGKVYVVEFWATWCGPCIKGIPHLTELQKEYKDKGVSIIGVASSERGNDAKSKLVGVENFVRKQAKAMEYTVAFDADRSMSKDWMAAAGRNGIPCAFLVGPDGKIAWIGHPANGLDAELKKATASKRVGSKNSDGSTQVASNSDESSSSNSSSQTSSSSSSNSSSETKSDGQRKSGSDSKTSSDNKKSSDRK